MGMPISVLARGAAARAERAALAVEAVFAELREVDDLFSTFRPDSWVSRLKRGEITLDVCRPEVIEVARRCLRARDLTDGLFDAVRGDGSWDPAGLVKGWAAERAARHLTDVGELDWCLNAGGDVVLVSRSGQSFGVGVQDPRDPARVIARVACANGAVATSGTAVRGSHLYDPRTGREVSGPWLSVTVHGMSLETADVLATAAFVAGKNWADVVSRVLGYEGLAVAADGSLSSTPGWLGRGNP
jgi:thiamine biosynthesis lipoprotein